MFRFSSPLLPVTVPAASPGAPFARWQNAPGSGAPFYRIQRTEPNPLSQSGEIPAETEPGIYTIPIESSIFGILSLVIGGQVFTPAPDIANLQPGQFYYDPYQQVVILASDQPIQGSPYYLQASDLVIPTNLVAPPWPDWINQLPVTGEISWSLQLGEQPSGSMELEFVGDIEAVKTTLQAGFLLDFWGVGLAISQPQVTERHRRNTPLGSAAVSTNLSGVWEWQASQPAFLLGIPQGFSGTSGTAPECSPIGSPPPRPSVLSRNTSVQALAAQVGVPLQAPEIEVSIPADTQSLDTVSWADELQSAALRLCSFIDWHGSDAVKLQRYDQARTWTYAEAQIDGEVSAQFKVADAPIPRIQAPSWRVPEPNLNTPFPGSVALPALSLQPESLTLKPSFRYTSQKVQGDFLQTQESQSDSAEVNQLPTQPPTWTQVPSVSKVLISGDPDPESSPGDPEHLSNNADVSGFTKRRVITRILNGAPQQEEIWVFGWMFTGEDLKNSNVTWGVVEYRKTTYQVDGATGYDLGHVVSGFKMLRHKIEQSDNPETLSLQPGDAKRDLYRYTQVPLLGGRSVKLGQIRDYYKSFEVSPPYSVYEICTGNGRVHPVAVIDPNWVEPMFVLEEVEWSRSIDIRPNPESTANAPKPDLMAGEETYNWRKVEPVAIFSGDGTLSQDPDGYREFRLEYRAQDAGFARSLEQAPFEEHLGFPTEASRTKSAYELQEQATPPDAEEPQPDPQSQADIYIRSGDYGGAPLGTLSFQGIETLAEFEQAAKTNLLEQRLDDLSETVTLASPNLEIRPGDLFVYVHNGTQRTRRVTEVNNTLTVQGMGIARRKVTAKTQLKVSLEPSTDIILSNPLNAAAPGNDPPPVIDLFFPYYPGRTLGEVQPPPSSSRFRY